MVDWDERRIRTEKAVQMKRVRDVDCLQSQRREWAENTKSEAAWKSHELRKTSPYFEIWTSPSHSSSPNPWPPLKNLPPLGSRICRTKYSARREKEKKKTANNFINQPPLPSNFQNHYFISLRKEKRTYFHENHGFLRAARTPQNERKQREKNHEAYNKSKEVAAAGEPIGAAVVLEKTLFFNGVEALPGLGNLVGGGRLARSGLDGGGESGGGGVTWVWAQRGVGVGVRGGPHWAEHRARVEGVSGLFPIVGIPWRALHIVNRPARARRPRGRRRRQTADLGVGLGQHRHYWVGISEWRSKRYINQKAKDSEEKKQMQSKEGRGGAKSKWIRICGSVCLGKARWWVWNSLQSPKHFILFLVGVKWREGD